MDIVLSLKASWEGGPLNLKTLIIKLSSDYQEEFIKGYKWQYFLQTET